jgi:hypothetical protein
MRHLVAGLGALAFTVWMWWGIRTSDSSTAAIGWLAVPPFVVWWVGCVYLAASARRRWADPSEGRRVGASGVALVALVALPLVPFVLSTVEGHDHGPALVQAVDPGPGGVPVVDALGTGGWYGCEPWTHGSWQSNTFNVYGVTCAEARRLAAHALETAPRPGASGTWTADGYVWNLDVRPIDDPTYLQGTQTASDGSARRIGIELTRP